MAPLVLNTSSPTIPFECLWDGCGKTFRSQEDLDKHRMYGSDGVHSYCKKCNECFWNWDKKLEHMIASPRHAICPLCTVEFRARGTLESHLQQAHPASQNITCFACDRHFTRAGAYIHHFEKGHCREHTADEFNERRQHKAMLSRVAQESGESDPFSAGSQARSLFNPLDVGNESRPAGEPSVAAPSYVPASKGSPSVLSEDGGVPLSYLDLSNDDGGMQQPGLPPMSLGNSASGGNGRKLIGDFNQDTSNNRHAGGELPIIEKLAIDDRDHGSVTVKGEPSKQGERGPVATPGSQSHEAKAFTTSTWREPTHHATLHWKRFAQSESKEPGQTANKNDACELPIFSQGQTWRNKEKSFPQAKTQAMTSDSFVSQNPAAFEAGLAALDKRFRSERSMDVQGLTQPNAVPTQLTRPLATPAARFWDPDHADFNPEAFFNLVVGKYSCPWPNCEHSFNTTSDLRVHLRGNLHKKDRFPCPKCNKTFTTNSALIQHFESSSVRCNIRNSRNYQQILYEVSGGYLGVKREPSGENVRGRMQGQEDHVYFAEKPGPLNGW